MVRSIFAAVALFVFVGGISAAEYKGRLAKVDAEKNTITILVGAKKGEKGEEKTFKIAKDAKFVSIKPPAVKGDKPIEETLTGGIKNEVFTVSGKGGPGVTLTTTGEGDKEEATEVKVSAGKKKKDK